MHDASCGRRGGPAASAVSAVADALPFGSRLAEYEILQVLGHGGFGITYLARDLRLEKTVAIKEYLPRDLAVRGADLNVLVRGEDCREAFEWGREQFLKEARVLARFSHANVIAIYRFLQAHATDYFVMEYAEGVSLEQVLRREGTLEEGPLLALLLPLLSGLEQVHRGGILHRDIKPANIILRHTGGPVLIDFGAARQNLGSRTQSLLSMMTAGYAPVEQYAEHGDQGPWTDLYALAAVAYRALSGRRPDDAVNRVHKDPLVPATVVGQGRYSPALLAAIDWGLAVNAEERPQSVAEWREALRGERSVAPRAAPPIAPRGDDEDTELLLRQPQVTPPANEAVDPPAPERVAMRAPRRRRQVLFSIAGAFALAALAVAYSFLPDSAKDAPIQTGKPGTQDASSRRTMEPPVKAAAATREAPPAAEARPAAPAARPKAVRQMKPLSEFKDCPECPRMVVLPGGRFAMGAPPGPATHPWEEPVREVQVARLAIGLHEVTRRQWQACVRAGACAAPAWEAGDERLPATHLDWAQARAYATWLSATTSRRYRLPSEAEWEYALRAGTKSARYWGEDRRGQCLYANAADLSSQRLLGGQVRRAECDDGHAGAAPVGGYRPNAFGLHDLAGNVWEWTLDCWRDSHAGSPADARPVKTDKCDRRVIRGGSWRTRPESLRSAARGWSPPAHRSDDLGLRVVAE